MLQDFVIDYLPLLILLATVAAAMGIVLLIVIIRILLLTIKRLTIMQELVTKLVADVEAQKEVIASAKTLLTGLNTSLQAAISHAENNGGDLSKLNELAAEIEAQTADLAAAVAANTPPAAEAAPADGTETAQ